MVSRIGNLHKELVLHRTVLFLAVFLGMLIACSPTPNTQEPVIRPVRYTEVITGGNPVSRTYSGTAKAELETDLSFRVSGTLTERPVTIGERVQPGDLIASLDRTDFQVRVNESLAGLAQADAERRNATANFDRTRDLYETQNASRTELDSARSRAESTEAQYRVMTQRVEAARLQLSYTSLLAPQACTIARTYAQRNQNVSQGQPIVRVNCGGCAEVVVGVPGTDISRINRDNTVVVNVSAFPNQAMVGRVEEIGVATGTNSSTFSVTVSLQEQCSMIRSGMAVDVTFEFPDSTLQESLIVPYVSVGEDRQGNYVFVLEPTENDTFMARRRSVRIGEAMANGISIEEGISLGELIATAGVRRLIDGQEVQLLPSSDSAQ